MARISNSILEVKVKNINEALKLTEGRKFFLSFAYNGIRLCREAEGGGCEDCSARISRAEMVESLDTLYTAICRLGLTPTKN